MPCDIACRHGNSLLSFSALVHDPTREGCDDADETPASVDDLLHDCPNVPPPDVRNKELRSAPPGNADDSWYQCWKLTDKYDKDLCNTYREQLDTLLVFAGLFSAVVTAFCIESYQWLQPDPADTSADLLRQVVGLLAQNQTQIIPVSTAQPSTGLSSSVVARINVYWFVALTLSLSAALVAILCKQWVREYERDAGQTHKQGLGVRHVKLEGLAYWRVGAFVSSVPLLLQLALALFLVGIVELLWRLHAAVATATTVVASLTAIFYLATAALPACQYAYVSVFSGRPPAMFPRSPWFVTGTAFTAPQCPYKSPQAWLLMRLVQPLIDRAMCVASRNLHRSDSWIAFDVNWTVRRDAGSDDTEPTASYRALAWLVDNATEPHLLRQIWHCQWDRCWTSDSDEKIYHDIDGVTDCLAAHTGPLPPKLGSGNTWFIRAQSSLFRSSICTGGRSELALELLLRIVPHAGLTSEWVARSFKAVGLNPSAPLSDALAAALVRLLHQQQWHLHSAVACRHLRSTLYWVVSLLCPAHPLRRQRISAICAVALDRLLSLPRDGPLRHLHARVATAMLGAIAASGLDVASQPDVQGRPDIDAVVALTKLATELNPSCWDRYDPHGALRMLSAKLLAISLSEAAPDVRHSPGSTSSRDDSAGADRSHAPRVEVDIRALAQDPVAPFESAPASHATDLKMSPTQPSLLHTAIEMHAMEGCGSDRKSAARFAAAPAPALETTAVEVASPVGKASLKTVADTGSGGCEL